MAARVTGATSSQFVTYVAPVNSDVWYEVFDMNQSYIKLLLKLKCVVRDGLGLPFELMFVYETLIEISCSIQKFIK